MELVQEGIACSDARCSSDGGISVTQDGLLVVDGEVLQPVEIKIGQRYVRCLWTSRLEELVSRVKLETECK